MESPREEIPVPSQPLLNKRGSGEDGTANDSNRTTSNDQNVTLKGGATLPAPWRNPFNYLSEVLSVVFAVLFIGKRHCHAFLCHGSRF